LPDQLNIAIIASGKGSNFKSILDAIKSGKIPNTQIALLISNNSDAGAFEVARGNNIPALHINRKQFATDEDFNSALLSSLQKHHVNFIALAGYMKKIDPMIVKTFKNHIINIHPALLPKFGGSGMYGLHVHRAVIASKDKISGASIHIVDEEYDHGPVVLQKSVPVEANDTPESLAARVLKIEHEIYPEAIRLFAEGKVKVNEGKIIITKNSG
jgi:formyltetrahydrofolate-dependent phosphoribosylglycinamide formyltransferase